MTFDHLRSKAFAAGQLLLGAQQVCELMIQVPDLAEHFQLCFGVEAQIPDEGAHRSPVLLIDLGSVSLFSGLGLVTLSAVQKAKW